MSSSIVLSTYQEIKSPLSAIQISYSKLSHHCGPDSPALRCTLGLRVCIRYFPNRSEYVQDYSSDMLARQRGRHSLAPHHRVVLRDPVIVTPPYTLQHKYTMLRISI